MDLKKIDARIEALKVRRQESAKKAGTGAFKFAPFSKKQKQLLTWWMPASPVKDMEGIIADGAIRSGKTLAMSLSFIIWAMTTFASQNFAVCGKTIGSFRRNVLFWLKIMLRTRGYGVRDMRTDNLLIVSRGTVQNYCYLFGGKDERSQDLIQGLTLAGVLFDEVALMPESFVNQALARCSVAGSKYWFNCNPQGPFHWFYLNWIQQANKKRILYLHFLMDDNLSLHPKVKARYEANFRGVFFQRYVRGLWVAAEGLIYDMFDYAKHVCGSDPARSCSEYYISIDYGTQNPMAYGLWGKSGRIWYKVKEYHYDGRKTGVQKTDMEYYIDLEAFAGDLSIRAVVVDPSAASFIAQIKRAGRFNVKKAHNDVDEGIRNMATAITTGEMQYCDCCTHTIEEIASYVWDDKAVDKGREQPLKQNDHHMDSDRYFVNTILVKRGVQTW